MNSSWTWVSRFKEKGEVVLEGAIASVTAPFLEGLIFPNRDADRPSAISGNARELGDVARMAGALGRVLHSS